MRRSENCRSFKKGISKVRLTGGEPEQERDHRFISRLSQVQGTQDLSLTTNGVLLKEFAAPLKQAGLNSVNISLDSLKRERFHQITRRDEFDRVWSGIEEALRVGLTPIKINMVAIQGLNDDEIEDFARLTLEIPVTVRYIEYMPAGNGKTWKKSDLLTIPQIKSRLEKVGPLVCITSEPWDGPAKRYRIEGAMGEIGLIGAVSSHFCSDCNRIRLTPDGKIRTCLFSDDEIDVRELLRKGGSDDDLKKSSLRPFGQSRKDIRSIHQFKVSSMSAIGGNKRV
jgi:cyclic pyranopterin phosphate synthase